MFLERLRKIVPRKLHLVIEELFRVLFTVRDDTCSFIGVEEHLIEVEDTEKGRHTQLSGLEDDREEPQVIDDDLLRPVWVKFHLFTLLGLDVVEIFNSPSPVLQIFVQFLLFFI